MWLIKRKQNIIYKIKNGSRSIVLIQNKLKSFVVETFTFYFILFPLDVIEEIFRLIMFYFFIGF